MPWFRGQRSIRAVEPSGIGTCPADTATIRARFNSPSPLGLTRSPTNRAGPDGLWELQECEALSVSDRFLATESLAILLSAVVDFTVPEAEFQFADMPARYQS